MKRLGGNQAALDAQAKLWGDHMALQFADRQIYWSNRSMSRLKRDLEGEATTTCILDSMDHSKWSLPRSANLEAKKFNAMVRPHLECTAIILHGHMVAIAFAESHVVKGANYTCELLMFALNKLTLSGVDLREYELVTQYDNCSKEGKNNSVCRLMAYLTATRAIRNARMHFCMSGHSHEDIDQFFSLLGAFLGTQPELHDATEFIQALQKYMSNPSVRCHEKMREVIKIDAVRDWFLERICRLLLVDDVDH